MKNRCLFLFALFLTACAHQEVAQNKLNTIDQIGVVAVFDERLPVDVVPSKNDKSADIVEWSLNQNIEDELEKGFRSLDKKSFSVKVDPSIIESGKSAARGLKNIYLGNRYQGLEQYLLNEAEKQGAQYLLVLHPMSLEKYPNYAGGYGLRCQNPKDDLIGYGVLQAQLWNLRTRTVESRTVLSPQDVSFKTGKTCAEVAKIPTAKLASTYRDQVVALAKKSAELAITRTGESTVTK